MDPTRLAADARLFVATAQGYEDGDPELYEVLQRALGLILVLADTLDAGGTGTVGLPAGA